MNWKERKAMMEALDPELLKGGKTPKDVSEGYFRWHLLQLLGDIADAQGSLDYKYSEMLKLQQAKSGGPARGSQPGTENSARLPSTEKSRYGGPQ